MADDQIDYWSGEAGERWAADAEFHDRMLAAFLAPLLDVLAPQPGERVLDVGCGNGALSLAVAERVAPGGSVTGVDVSPQMLAVARDRAAGRDGVAFVQADAATADLDGFDAWTSRFGVMFFDDSAAAFANLAAALRPGGRAVFACWRDLLAQQWLMVPATAALDHVALPDFGDADEPGAFRLGDPDRLTALLTGAGLVEVDLRPVDAEVPIGADVPAAMGFLVHSGFADRLLEGADEDTVAKVWAAVADVLEPLAGPEGVLLGGGVWIASARRPA
jgi:SAM-dependent methyltransferase